MPYIHTYAYHIYMYVWHIYDMYDIYDDIHTHMTYLYTSFTQIIHIQIYIYIIVSVKYI